MKMRLVILAVPPSMKTNCFLGIVLVGCLMQSFTETVLCTFLGGDERGNTLGASVGTDSSREYSLQNRHAPLYLTCITPCEAEHQRGLLLVLADK